MKKFVKEIVVTFIQLLSFYLLPLFAGNADPMGLVLLLVFLVSALSFLLGIISKNKVKFFYPIVIAVSFIPSVFIYYNESALIHAAWYLFISLVGVCVGSLIRKAFNI